MSKFNSPNPRIVDCFPFCQARLQKSCFQHFLLPPPRKNDLSTRRSSFQVSLLPCSAAFRLEYPLKPSRATVSRSLSAGSPSQHFTAIRQFLLTPPHITIYHPWVDKGNKSLGNHALPRRTGFPTVVPWSRFYGMGVVQACYPMARWMWSIMMWISWWEPLLKLNGALDSILHVNGAATFCEGKKGPTWSYRFMGGFWPNAFFFLGEGGVPAIELIIYKLGENLQMSGIVENSNAATKAFPCLRWYSQVTSVISKSFA